MSGERDGVILAGFSYKGDLEYIANYLQLSGQLLSFDSSKMKIPNSLTSDYKIFSILLQII